MWKSVKNHAIGECSIAGITRYVTDWATKISRHHHHLKVRYVDHARDPGKDSIIIIVRNHTTSTNDMYDDLPYYVWRIQRSKRYIKLRWFN